jgi:hypothetical protein
VSDQPAGILAVDDVPENVRLLEAVLDALKGFQRPVPAFNALGVRDEAAVRLATL